MAYFNNAEIIDILDFYHEQDKLLLDKLHTKENLTISDICHLNYIEKLKEDNKNWYGIIYAAINKKLNKTYFGQTIKTLEKRRREHLTEGDFYFQRALRKNPKDFSWQVVRIAYSKKELDNQEKFLIEFYNGKADPNIGYNLHEGGTGGKTHEGPIHSEEQKLKWSQDRKGSKNANYGKRRKFPSITGDKNPACRPEVRKKISESLKINRASGGGRAKTEEAKQKQKTAIGKIWITKLDDPDTELYIKKEDLGLYIDNGWKKGRKKSIAVKMSETVASRENPCSNTIWIHKYTENNKLAHKRIPPNSFEEFKKDGWELGYGLNLISKETLELIIEDRKNGLSLKNISVKYDIKYGTLKGYMRTIK